MIRIGIRNNPRLVLFLFIGVYISILLFLHYVMGYGYTESWSSMGVDPMYPSFSDLRAILTGIECHEMGYNVLVENPCDPWNRRMTYPSVWLAFGKFGLNGSHTIIVGIVFAALYFLSVLFILNPETVARATIYGVGVVSPTAMLAVERGNNDLFIFAILAAAIFLFTLKRPGAQALSALSVFAAGALKLYPIVAACMFLVRQKRGVILLFAVMIAFLVYLAFTWTDVVTLYELTSRGTKLSYGYRVAFDIVERYPQLRSLDSTAWFTALPPALLTATSAGSVILALRHSAHVDVVPERAGLCFLAGASIFVGTFVIGNNYDYRLVFTLMTLPQLLNWAADHDDRFIRTTSVTTILGVLATLWLSSVTIGDPPDTSLVRMGGFLLDELINWYVFLAMLFFLTQILWPHCRAILGLAPRRA